MVKIRLYNAIRPTLQRMGLLRIGGWLLSPQRRAQIAHRVGLGGYVAPLPHRQPYLGPVRADGVNYIADLRADIGVGESARAIYAAMRAAEIPVNYQEVATPLVQRSSSIDASTVDQCYSITLAHLNPPEMQLGIMRYPHSFQNCYAIGYWLWEVPRLPESWRVRANAVDELWTSSRYTQNILSEAVQIPVNYMPIPVTVAPEPVIRAQFGIPEGPPMILFAFNPGSSMARKNPHGLIEAYRRAFTGMEQKPVLVIKAHHLARYPTVAPQLREAVRQVGGILIEDHLTRPQMHGLIALADVVVSLHRAEGFGFLMAEAMLLGKPVIATSYSSNMDFMTSNNSFLVQYTLREITDDDHRAQPLLGQIYTPGQLWAEPDLDHAAYSMRQVFDDPNLAREKATIAQSDLATGWSTHAIGERITRRLQQLV